MSDWLKILNQPERPAGIKVVNRGVKRGKVFDSEFRNWHDPVTEKLSTFSESSKNRPNNVPKVAAPIPRLPPIRLITTNVSLPSAALPTWSSANTRAARL